MQLVSHTLFRSHILGPIGAAAAAADDADEDAVLTESPDRGAADDITIASKPLSLRRYQCKPATPAVFKQTQGENERCKCGSRLHCGAGIPHVVRILW